MAASGVFDESARKKRRQHVTGAGAERSADFFVLEIFRGPLCSDGSVDDDGNNDTDQEQELIEEERNDRDAGDFGDAGRDQQLCAIGNDTLADAREYIDKRRSLETIDAEFGAASLCGLYGHHHTFCGIRRWAY